MSLTSRSLGLTHALAAALLIFAAVSAHADDPIRIGFGMSLTGKLAANGKMALLGMQIWEDDTNAHGGLLGRPVKLIYYDDQSDPAHVPGIYAKLLDIDKVDLIVSGYASTQIAAAMPIAIERRKLLIGLSGTAINDEFHYPMYFAMVPNGPSTKPAFTHGFFKVAEAQNPKPQTIALAYADAEFGHNTCEGARANAKDSGLQNRLRQELSAGDGRFRADRARDPGGQSGFIGGRAPIRSTPSASSRRCTKSGFKPKMWGGAMVGLQSTALKVQLGPLLNGIVNFETWLPVGPLKTPAAVEFLGKYQERAKFAGADAMAYFPVMAYADLQVLGDAVTATKTLKDDALAAYMHKATFNTVVGGIRFGENGEWAEERMLAAQFQNIKSNSADEFRDLKTEIVVYPPDLKSGEVIYPYEKALGK